MVSIINLGGAGAGSSSTWKTILIIALLGGIGYLIWTKYFGGSNGLTDTGGGGIQTGSDIIGDTAGTLSDLIQSGGSGLEIPKTDTGLDIWSGGAESLWNLATGVLKINPFTAPLGSIYDWATGGINDLLKWGSGDIAPAPTDTGSTPDVSTPAGSKYTSTKVTSTKMTTPTIPEYTTTYVKEIKESEAPAIVKSKILAGKIW